MCLADVKVVDEQMNECPPGVVGEIVIRGEQVLKGYFRNEEGTPKAFDGGWFHTGDMARRDEEGFFYIVDRMKDMIITGGENVYSREVEEVLYTHPSVAEAAVVGLPDPMWGENVTAVIVLRAGDDGDRGRDHRHRPRPARRVRRAGRGDRGDFAGCVVAAVPHPLRGQPDVGDSEEFPGVGSKRCCTRSTTSPTPPRCTPSSTGSSTP